jgi:uncharacterized protein YyaL (SSP411 family)
MSNKKLDGNSTNEKKFSNNINDKKFTNNLINEKSPYLLQHAHNPVNWYPWSEDAFKKACGEDKPIFLSIGYSTCHWCHVMERESFEDADTAKILNDKFVCIKVDREERPDIDGVYMNVCRLLTGGGGWPLSVFMDGQKRPFFAGTYFPKEDMYGVSGFKNILNTVSQLYASDRKKIDVAANDILRVLNKRQVGRGEGSRRNGQVGRNGGSGDSGRNGRGGSNEGSGHTTADTAAASVNAAVNGTASNTADRLNAGTIDKAFEYLAESFDQGYGGFSPPPKFPTPQNLLFLLRYYASSKNEYALTMVEKTLTAMYEGGIYDHVGFGFSRYSTDGRWLAPHFEKMLYDNALLALCYLDAYRITKKNLYKRVAEQIFEFVLRDMTDENGGFYCAVDADSEGEEGRFYLWSYDEVIEILGGNADIGAAATTAAAIVGSTATAAYTIDPDTANVVAVKVAAAGAANAATVVGSTANAAILAAEKFCRHFNITPSGNFEGKNILNLIAAEPTCTGDAACAAAAVATRADPTASAADTLENAYFDECLKKLFIEREKRPRPFLDKKILTSQNGLMIAALSEGGRILHDRRYTAAAKKAFNFVTNTLNADGKLKSRYIDGEVKFDAYADDYAFLTYAALSLYGASHEEKYLEHAVNLTQAFIDRFWDGENGAFFFYGADGEKLLFRPKEISDDAYPSANSMSVYNLVKLARLTGNGGYEDKAVKTLNLFSEQIESNVAAHIFSVLSLWFLINGNEIVFAAKNKAELLKMTAAFDEIYAPQASAAFLIGEGKKIKRLAPFIKNYKTAPSGCLAYICKNRACLPPVDTVAALREMLSTY